MISILVRPTVRGLLATQRLRRRAKSLLRWCDLSHCELCIVLTDDTEITELNAVYRGKEKPTDVLSFSQFESGDDIDAFGVAHLGDIVISLETAKRQASRGCMTRLQNSLSAYGPSRKSPMNWCLESEVLFLVLHGFLHLRGYDHIDSADAERMEALEAELIPYVLSRFPIRSG